MDLLNALACTGEIMCALTLSYDTSRYLMILLMADKHSLFSVETFSMNIPHVVNR